MMQLLLTEFASCRHQNKVPGFLKNRGFLISFYMHFVATAVCICNSMTPLLVYLSLYSLEWSTWCTVPKYYHEVGKLFYFNFVPFFFLKFSATSLLSLALNLYFTGIFPNTHQKMLMYKAHMGQKYLMRSSKWISSQHICSKWIHRLQTKNYGE